MLRHVRLDAPGTVHHVIIRDIEKRRIVNDAENRRRFVEHLGQLAIGIRAKSGMSTCILRLPPSCFIMYDCKP
jgi:hypothetical protein